MAFELEIEALRAADRAARLNRNARMAAVLKLKAYRERVRCYSACFLGPDSELTREAQIVIGELAIIAGMGREPTGQSDGELREQAGARRVVLHLMEFLREDPTKLHRMVQKTRELLNDE